MDLLNKNNSIIVNNTTLKSKNEELNKKLKEENAKNEILTLRVNDITNKISSDVITSNDILEMFLLYMSKMSAYINLNSIDILVMRHHTGNTLCKYADSLNIDISTIYINKNIQINDNNINFLGFSSNGYIYINIPNFINDRYVNTLTIGDRDIKIQHDFYPLIYNSVIMPQNTNTSDTNVVINGINMFEFTKINLSCKTEEKDIHIEQISEFEVKQNNTSIIFTYNTSNLPKNHSDLIVEIRNYDLPKVSTMLYIKPCQIDASQ